MRKLAFLLLPALFCCAGLCAQTPDYRFGKVSEEELRMERYDKDPDAKAVILYEENELDYQIGSVGIDRVTNYFVRIKILKTEGTDVANINIVYINSRTLQEVITGLDAIAYNLADNKIIKTPLKKQYIFREEVGKDTYQMKFSIPEVKVGTVIEYRYSLSSNNLTNIPDFRFQHDIPVAQSSMKASIPEFFRFKVNTTGFHKINYEESTASSTIPGGSFFSIRVFKADVQDIPALKSEPFIWHLNDFCSTLRFELSEIAIPFMGIQSFISSWGEVNNLLASSTFLDHTKIENPFKEQVAAIKKTELSPQEKARAVLKLIQSKMKWDGTYQLFSDSPRAAATKGAGTSADINFVLMAALKDAGFPVLPVLLSPRHMGRLPYKQPTIDGIRAFILGIGLEKDKYVYADGTDPNSDINLLPLPLLVDRARIFPASGQMGWCNLSKMASSTQNTTLLLKLETDETVSGTVIEQQGNQAALRVSTKYTESKSQEEFIESIEKEQEIQIEDFQIKGVGTSEISLQYKMTSSSVNATDEFVYLNATILPFMSKSQFESQTRMLPIEFPEMSSYTIRGSMSFPEGYTVESLPENIGMTACEGGLKCRYQAQLAGMCIQFSLQFSISRLFFTQYQYEDLKAFFGRVVDLNNNQIVLRKKNT